MEPSGTPLHSIETEEERSGTFLERQRCCYLWKAATPKQVHLAWASVMNDKFGVAKAFSKALPELR
jgi:hypothetical protein